MKFSEAWLREWVNPPVETQELSDQLSMAGLEVDGVESAAAAFQGVVVGEVLTREQHPNADKLSLCSVNIGAKEPSQIICGAPNVAAGQKVPVAVIGAILPGDFKIKKAKLRGVESQGMICSASELGLTESSDGIMELVSDAPVGVDFRSYLSLDDQVIDVDLTPDRGDCLGLSGIAREVGVINRVAVNSPDIQPVEAVHDDCFQVDLVAGDACPRYTCRIVRNINAKGETPHWIQERLRRSGLRPIHPVVDVTNYVMLELGQPMHGFDLRQLNEKIVVRMAQEGELLTLLDGQEIKLREDTLVIADRSKTVAIAGIMGGEHSGVVDDTCDILLECAFFTPTSIIGKARSYGLHTDSSHRYERGVDSQLQAKAMERATRLLLDIVGGEPGPIVEAKLDEYLPQPKPVLLRRDRVALVLGVRIDDQTIVDILSRLEMKIEAADQGWQVTAPSCRFDIRIEEDLIEEVGRIYGYTEIPVRHTNAATALKSEPEAAFDLLRAKQLLVDRDYQEAITYSFISPAQQQTIDPDIKPVMLANPISEDMSAMRTSLWPGLLETARYNQSRQQNRVRIFESGLRFIHVGEEIQQDVILAGLASGDQLDEQWGASVRPIDFFDLKGDLEAILSLTGCEQEFGFIADSRNGLHPGQSAKIIRNGEAIGWIGMLHPELEKGLGLSGKTYLFEILIKGVQQGAIPDFELLSKYPSIRRDLALVVGQDVEFGAIRDAVRIVTPKIIQDIRLFDVYTGGKVDSGRKSLALSLILQESSYTLTDAEVEAVVDDVLQTLSTDFDAKLRD
ncbi:MAG: phenylalanine--tRNA ligase subunit beta [Gammaproteobacteria bacterium]|nr:phenylalanine--tRNA ligase subunit beta [Gammaproteobacteria bacterium]